MEEGRTALKVFNGKLGGKRKRGRPKKRWIEDVEEDLNKLGTRGWKQKAMNREEWTDIIREARILHGL